MFKTRPFLATMLISKLTHSGINRVRRDRLKANIIKGSSFVTQQSSQIRILAPLHTNQQAPCTVVDHVFLIAIQILDLCLLGRENSKLLGPTLYLEQRTFTYNFSKLETISQLIFINKAWFITSKFLNLRPPWFFGKHILSQPTILIL